MLCLLQVMHCVLYPKLEYDIPILSLDMVGNEKGEVSLAIVDPCPCVLDGNIPHLHREAARQASCCTCPAASCAEAVCAFLDLLLSSCRPALLADMSRTRWLFHICRQLQEKHGLQNNRKIPEWGQDIFSDMCVIMRPQSQDELQRFMLYCSDLHRVYLHLSFHVAPLTEQR